MYLRRTIRLYEEIIAQVHAVLERGAPTLAEIGRSLRLDPIRQEFTGEDAGLGAASDRLVGTLVRQAVTEGYDGVASTP